MSDNNFNDEFNPKETKNPPAGGAPQPVKSSNTKKILIAVGAVAIALVFFFVGWIVRYFTLDPRARTLMWLIDTIDDNYYKEIPDEEWDALYEQFYEMVLPDRFCSYFSPDEYKRLLGEGEGNNKDAGFSAIDEGENLRVYNVIGNSPASNAGLKSGMYIYRFGTSENNMKAGNRDGLYALSGNAIYLECGYHEEDKKVYCIAGDTYLASYCSYRDNEFSYDFYTNENGKLSLEKSKTQNPLTGADEKTAYISIAEFNGNVAEEFAVMLDLMKERGRENLIIDLRRNGGGYLNDFQSIASHLLKNAEGNSPLVATAKYRSGKQVKFKADGNDYAKYFAQNSRVKILADEWTASASESLMGALVDYGTVGFGDIYLRKTEGETAHSYGKGVMQSAYTSANGSGVRVTSAEIFWPLSGRSIHETGVTEEMGGVGIVAPLLSGERDIMLEEVLSRLNGGTL